MSQAITGTLPEAGPLEEIEILVWQETCRAVGIPFNRTSSYLSVGCLVVDLDEADDDIRREVRAEIDRCSHTPLSELDMTIRNLPDVDLDLKYHNIDRLERAASLSEGDDD